MTNCGERAAHSKGPAGAGRCARVVNSTQLGVTRPGVFFSSIWVHTGPEGRVPVSSESTWLSEDHTERSGSAVLDNRGSAQLLTGHLGSTG